MARETAGASEEVGSRFFVSCRAPMRQARSSVGQSATLTCWPRDSAEVRGSSPCGPLAQPRRGLKFLELGKVLRAFLTGPAQFWGSLGLVDSWLSEAGTLMTKRLLRNGAEMAQGRVKPSRVARVATRVLPRS